MNRFKLILVLSIAGLLSSCKNKTTETQTKPLEINPQEAEVATSSTENKVIGIYVSEGYQERYEGYDWVGVRVKAMENNQIKIQVRSRADNKKPTCTLDAVAFKVNDSLYNAKIDGNPILFKFSDDLLVIAAEVEANNGTLNFYCSGGATVAGSYQKINEPLDASQVDKTQFSKVLYLQDIGFNVSATKDKDATQLTIFAFGLPVPFDQTIDIGNQTITNAVVEDLNSDGSPELLVFAKEDNSNARGMVYAYSVNNKKSMSRVSFTPTKDNTQINTGYIGFDEFTLIETSLAQRFPIYKNGEPTGKIRQIQYNLVDAEAARKFEVVSESEF